MIFMQELLGLFGINLKFFLYFKFSADFVIFFTLPNLEIPQKAAENFAAPQLPTISITFRVMIMGREAS